MNQVIVKIGSIFKALRIHAGLSYEQMVLKAPDLDKASLCLFERGSLQPTIREANIICSVLKVPDKSTEKIIAALRHCKEGQRESLIIKTLNEINIPLQVKISTSTPAGSASTEKKSKNISDIPLSVIPSIIYIYISFDKQDMSKVLIYSDIYTNKAFTTPEEIEEFRKQENVPSDHTLTQLSLHTQHYLSPQAYSLLNQLLETCQESGTEDIFEEILIKFAVVSWRNGIFQEREWKSNLDTSYFKKLKQA